MRHVTVGEDAAPRPSAVRQAAHPRRRAVGRRPRLSGWTGRGVAPLLADAAVIAAGVAAYFGVRGVTEGSAQTAVEHAQDLLQLERAIGLDVEAGLQAAVSDVPAVITVANWVYIWGHWPALVATLLWLAVARRSVFRRLRDAMAISGAMGLCVYVTYPVAPPRLAGLGMADTVTEQSYAYRVLQPPAFANQYAALPSLHVGWNLLLGLALVAAAGGGLLLLIGRTTPVLMASATVITANHFVLDVAVGLLFGLVGWVVAGRLEARRQSGSDRPPPRRAVAGLLRE